MTLILGWALSILLHPPEEAEMTERLSASGLPGELLGPRSNSRHVTRAKRRQSSRRLTWPDGTVGAGKSCVMAISCSGWAMHGSVGGISR